MSMKIQIASIISFVLMSLSITTYAEINRDVENLRVAWATAKFQTSKNKQISEFEKLIQQAQRLDQMHPHQPEILVWYGTILSTYASIKGGISVLPQVKKARVLLEEAIHQQPSIEHGFAQGVLGTLYARVPSWPIAFGSKEKAREHLRLAVQISPEGCDSNYYYGDFLFNEGEYEKAKKHLEIAHAAPIRKGYEIQDQGRKEEIAFSLAKLQRLGH